MIIGKRHGRGEYIYLDGSKFDGNWDNDKINGEGTSWYPNGNRFVGQWVNGKINGSGTLFLATGDKYTGGKFMITHAIPCCGISSQLIFHCIYVNLFRMERRKTAWEWYILLQRW